MAYENFYQGSDNLFNPSYSLPTYKKAGYDTSTGSLSMSTDPRTANQLNEVNLKLNPGMKHIEISAIQANILESIPNQHLDEIRRISKLTGVEPSFHGPLVEATGINMQAQRFDETARIGAEKQLESAIIRSHQVSPKGNMSFTVHTTVGVPDTEEKIKINGKEKLERYWVVDPISGSVGAIPNQKEYFPEDGKFEPNKEKEFRPQDALKRINNQQWTENIAGINRYAEYGEDALNSIKKIAPNMDDETLKLIIKGADLSKIKQHDKDNLEVQGIKIIERNVTHAHSYLKDSYRNMKNLFDKAWVGANDEDKKKLEEYANWAKTQVVSGIESDPTKIRQLNEVVERGLKALGDIQTPETYKPLRGFAIEKAAETYGNVATSAYMKYKDKAPILNIENPPAGGGLSTGQDLKEVIIATRKKMEENLHNKGFSKSEATSISEKMIGATWDVGHINMMRKKGFTEQDVIKQTEIIAPYVKHAHLSDNFGLDHTELPMGMGNVPFEQMMKKLEDAGFKGQKVIEAGDWWQHFAAQGGGNPFKPTIESFDSPIYAMKASPSWYQASYLIPGYYSGQGPINPAIHHQLYGSGLSTIPMELGGEVQGNRDRFSGSPMQ